MLSFANVITNASGLAESVLVNPGVEGFGNVRIVPAFRPVVSLLRKAVVQPETDDPLIVTELIVLTVHCVATSGAQFESAEPPDPVVCALYFCTVTESGHPAGEATLLVGVNVIGVYFCPDTEPTYSTE